MLMVSRGSSTSRKLKVDRGQLVVAFERFSTMLAVVVTAVWWVFLVSVSKPKKANGVGWKHPFVCH